MKIVFWISIIGTLYSYFLYPLLLALIPVRRRAGAKTEAPMISVIIAAHNEASRMSDKLDNTLATDYPRERLEVIVASDASDDGTDEIVSGYASRGVRLVRAAQRVGKENAQALAVERAHGEILVFTDAATRLDKQGLTKIVEPFCNPRVGAVSSEDRFVHQDGSPAGEGAYVRYEMWLRRLEADRAGLVGLSGSFFAARRDVCANWDKESPSDFNTAMSCVRLRYTAVVAPEAKGYYRDIRDGRQEYRRKYRTVLRGITGLWRNRGVLNPWKYGMFSWQVWSHKPMRWAVPWFLVGLAVSSLSLREGVYGAALTAQLVFYSFVLLGALSLRMRRLAPVRLAFFFMEVNAAVAHATLAFVLGNRITVWEPSNR